MSGVLLDALIAPTLAQQLGLANTSYQDAFVIAIAFIAGFLVQFLGWSVMVLVRSVLEIVGVNMLETFAGPAGRVVDGVLFLAPLAGVGYGIYRYLAWVGVGQRSVTVAFVGGFLLKVFLIPFIKWVAMGWGLKQFIKWVRGDGARTSKPDESAKLN